MRGKMRRDGGSVFPGAWRTLVTLMALCEAVPPNEIAGALIAIDGPEQRRSRERRGYIDARPPTDSTC